ncbi:hypothetical protein VTL71DRAFT_2422 [Oculimacula yallundae]|uniref:Uncharacterized protein n=1 Tax=Oculimacula yallundae TaxID=86028 RepID=A0ABR4CA65_9HELO
MDFIDDGLTNVERFSQWLLRSAEHAFLSQDHVLYTEHSSYLSTQNDLSPLVKTRLDNLREVARQVREEDVRASKKQKEAGCEEGEEEDGLSKFWNRGREGVRKMQLQIRGIDTDGSIVQPIEWFWKLSYVLNVRSRFLLGKEVREVLHHCWDSRKFDAKEESETGDVCGISAGRTVVGKEAANTWIFGVETGICLQRHNDHERARHKTPETIPNAKTPYK